MNDLYLVLRSSKNGAEVVIVSDGKETLALEGTEDAMRKTAASTAEKLGIAWYDMVTPPSP